MPDIQDTPITEEEWKNADPEKHKLKDAHGRLWTIRANLGGQTLGHALSVQCPGHDGEVLRMTNSQGRRHIIDEEHGTIIEFHKEGVALVAV